MGYDPIGFWNATSDEGASARAYAISDIGSEAAKSSKERNKTPYRNNNTPRRSRSTTNLARSLKSFRATPPPTILRSTKTEPTQAKLPFKSTRGVLPAPPTGTQGSAARHSPGRSSADRNEGSYLLEEKPQPPPHASSGGTSDRNANRDLPDEKPKVKTEGTSSTTAPPTQKTPKNKNSYASRKKLKAPADSDPDSLVGALEKPRVLVGESHTQIKTEPKIAAGLLRPPKSGVTGPDRPQQSRYASAALSAYSGEYRRVLSGMQLGTVGCRRCCRL
ncbi:uncharacterized protein PITG_19417 [Phytophthora infestans T30-4]|uniref:Uncharacterized protein n=1 Tax=Phytophthora infestans (strain T30-4) TaxID=403677 RepID=D0P094_PHYIT|nr:uncharacterized protein PITG_19417 [Phytophthora infestans T30-4]EEY70272.1 hypothetical protein PITG_19417 [Phytophthora infestans T30-4]|eukprot:XP_002996958.1 hypothetical protein PITG_19417 [Phytophthora infestans T30-4]